MDDLGTRIDPISPAADELRGDAVMPAQFYPARRGAAAVEPIMRLMGGILIDAMRSLERNFEARHPNARREFKEAQSWIFDDAEDGPFSFLCVCDSLEIDPRGLRASIVRWQRNRRSGDKQRMIRRSPVSIPGRTPA
jgi:hypothetical protein